MQRIVLLCIALCALFFNLPAVHAVDYFWQNATGGAFTEPSSWAPFVPPGVQGPGGPLDTVNFDLGTAEDAPYLITDVSGENDRLLVRNDSVHLSVFPGYSLASVGGATPSLVVGRANGDVANLILSGDEFSTFENDVTRIANNVGAAGTLTVEGLNWTSGNLRVGHAGEGSLRIDEAATVISTNASLGHLANSRGSASIDGEATWITTGELLVGRAGDGHLNILNSGIVISTSATIGSEAAGEGSVIVGGPSPSWTVQNTLHVGAAGDGSVRLTGGSITTNNVNVGGLPGSDGVVSVIDGDWTTVGLLTVGGQSVGPTVGGSGFFRVDSGNVLVNEIVVTPNGLVEFDGGVLNVGSMTVEQPTGKFNFTDGLLFLNEFNGDLVQQGGTLSPNSVTTIHGNYTLESAGRLSISILGEAAQNEYDTAIVSDTATLGGELSFLVNGLYDPDPTEVYTILTAGDLVGSFTNVASGQRIDDVNRHGSFVVHYGPASLFDPDHVVLASYLPPGPAGDYNNNGIVDAADYTVWRDNLGAPAGTLLNDVDGGTIDMDQYETWKENFGTSGAGAISSTSVPEPAPFAFFVAGSLLSTRSIRSRRRAPL